MIHLDGFLRPRIRRSSHCRRQTIRIRHRQSQGQAAWTRVQLIGNTVMLREFAVTQDAEKTKVKSQKQKGNIFGPVLGCKHEAIFRPQQEAQLNIH